jgi:hypothetical protein
MDVGSMKEADGHRVWPFRRKRYYTQLASLAASAATPSMVKIPTNRAMQQAATAAMHRVVAVTLKCVAEDAVGALGRSERIRHAF